MEQKIILLKCKSREMSGSFYYVTNEEKTAGLFYTQDEGRWMKPIEMCPKNKYGYASNSMREWFAPNLFYDVVCISDRFEAQETNWLELLVVTGHSKEQLLNKLEE